VRRETYCRIDIVRRRLRIMTTIPPTLQLRITIDQVEPPVWRELLVDSRASLHQLHRIIQILFSWYDYHLYEFAFDGRRFEAPDPEREVEDASRVKLYDLQLTPGAVLQYLYDFGDRWLHTIEVQAVGVEADPAYQPWLLDGGGRGPPEDCGGPKRYMQLLAALEVPLEDLEDDMRELVEWAGLDFDADEFSVEQARHALLLLAAWGLTRRPR
jgi:hypothetical protein